MVISVAVAAEMTIISPASRGCSLADGTEATFGNVAANASN
jgi:hypothetical protein